MIYHINPVAKPRMTQRDKWAKRPAVLRYRAYCDEIRLSGLVLPESYHITFIIPMPKSWSEALRKTFDGKPHRSKPDKDNLEKALLDALYDDDSKVWDGRVTKLWGRSGRIIVEQIKTCCR